MRKIAMLLAMAILFLLIGVVLANGGPAIDWYVIGAGGGHVESSDGVYALDGAIGQPVAGVTSNTPYELCAGFWCGATAEYLIYLPLVLRNS